VKATLGLENYWSNETNGHSRQIISTEKPFAVGQVNHLPHKTGLLKNTDLPVDRFYKKNIVGCGSIISKYYNKKATFV
jgi:hypothetical protein